MIFSRNRSQTLSHEERMEPKHTHKGHASSPDFSAIISDSRTATAADYCQVENYAERNSEKAVTHRLGSFALRPSFLRHQTRELSLSSQSSLQNSPTPHMKKEVCTSAHLKFIFSSKRDNKYLREVRSFSTIMEPDELNEKKKERKRKFNRPSKSADAPLYDEIHTGDSPDPFAPSSMNTTKAAGTNDKNGRAKLSSRHVNSFLETILPSILSAHRRRRTFRAKSSSASYPVHDRCDNFSGSFSELHAQTQNKSSVCSLPPPSVKDHLANSLHYSDVPTIEQVQDWESSFDLLLKDPCGRSAFKRFLRSEFSEENIEFWTNCETFKHLPPSKLEKNAAKMCSLYLAPQSPHEINLDAHTKKQTLLALSQLSQHTFDIAQQSIQALMKKDSYQRFLKSDIFLELKNLSHLDAYSNHIKHDTATSINPSSRLRGLQFFQRLPWLSAKSTDQSTYIQPEGHLYGLDSRISSSLANSASSSPPQILNGSKNCLSSVNLPNDPECSPVQKHDCQSTKHHFWRLRQFQPRTIQTQVSRGQTVARKEGELCPAREHSVDAPNSVHLEAAPISPFVSLPSTESCDILKQP